MVQTFDNMERALSDGIHRRPKRRPIDAQPNLKLPDLGHRHLGCRARIPDMIVDGDADRKRQDRVRAAKSDRAFGKNRGDPKLVIHICRAKNRILRWRRTVQGGIGHGSRSHRGQVGVKLPTHNL